MKLIDITLLDRKITCFKPNGKARSRVDIALVSHGYLMEWPKSVHEVLDGNLADHCHVYIEGLNISS